MGKAGLSGSFIGQDSSGCSKLPGSRSRSIYIDTCYDSACLKVSMATRFSFTSTPMSLRMHTVTAGDCTLCRADEQREIVPSQSKQYHILVLWTANAPSDGWGKGYRGMTVSAKLDNGDGWYGVSES